MLRKHCVGSGRGAELVRALSEYTKVVCLGWAGGGVINPMGIWAASAHPAPAVLGQPLGLQVAALVQGRLWVL